MFTQGPLINTGLSLDVAIEGPGFFQVQRPDGSTAFTRNGTLQVAPNGNLVVTEDLMVRAPA